MAQDRQEMGMESQPIDHETEAFKVLQVIEQRAWALGDEQYARLAKEAMDHLSLATTQPAEQSGAIADIASERRRQIEVEGWTPEHDDEHCYGEMAKAAACYAAGQVVSAIPHEMDSDRGAAGYRSLWPWDFKWWKPKAYRANLVRAGALIVAEIERLDRKGAAK